MLAMGIESQHSSRCILQSSDTFLCVCFVAFISDYFMFVLFYPVKLATCKFHLQDLTPMNEHVLAPVAPPIPVLTLLIGWHMLCWGG